jgi:hypothetical protein
MTRTWKGGKEERRKGGKEERRKGGRMCKHILVNERKSVNLKRENLK